MWTKNKTVRIAHRKARKEMFSYFFDFCCLWNDFSPAHVTVKQQCPVGSRGIYPPRVNSRAERNVDVVLSTKLHCVYGEKSSISVSVEKLPFHITSSFIFPLKLLRFFFQSRQPELRSLRTINRSSTLSSWPSVLLSSLTCTFYVWKASNVPKGLGHLCRYWD